MIRIIYFCVAMSNAEEKTEKTKVQNKEDKESKLEEEGKKREKEVNTMEDEEEWGECPICLDDLDSAAAGQLGCVSPLDFNFVFYIFD